MFDKRGNGSEGSYYTKMAFSMFYIFLIGCYGYYKDDQQVLILLFYYYPWVEISTKAYDV